MNHYDPQMANRVWQRVRGEASTQRMEDDLSGLPALLSRELSEAADYLTLMKRHTGRPRELARQLHNNARHQAAILRGICRLAELSCPEQNVSKQTGEKCAALLRRCYGQTAARIAAYDANCSHREFGAAFSQLAATAREQAGLLLELAGSLPE